jgi:DNA-binding beta-propeller fold protein YncE
VTFGGTTVGYGVTGRMTMPLLVTSAAGANGDGYGALLSFDRQGKPLGRFSEDERIADPRGLAIDRDAGLLFLNSGADRVLALDASGKVLRDTGPVEGLNPGGGVFGPDGRYYVGLRTTRTITAFRSGLNQAGEEILPSGIVPFPRGFAFGYDGRLFLASGIGPNGEGTNTIMAFAPGKRTQPVVLVADPELSPLDILVAPNGNIVVSSEHPFGAPDAVTTIREYDPMDGHLVRVLSPNGLAESRNPRGLRLGPDGTLYWVARDEVIGFDFVRGRCLGALVRHPRLNGQAVVLFP